MRHSLELLTKQEKSEFVFEFSEKPNTKHIPSALKLLLIRTGECGKENY